MSSLIDGLISLVEGRLNNLLDRGLDRRFADGLLELLHNKLSRHCTTFMPSHTVCHDIELTEGYARSTHTILVLVADVAGLRAGSNFQLCRAPVHPSPLKWL